MSRLFNKLILCFLFGSLIFPVFLIVFHLLFYTFFVLFFCNMFLFLGSQQLFTSYDCFVFAISSHGMELVQKDKQGNTVHQHAVEMFDGTYIYTKSILDFFSDRKCKALKGKPKLFFIQV